MFISKCYFFFFQILVSISDINVEVRVPAGAILSLVSAFFYALYLVFLRRKVDHEDKMDIPMFFGKFEHEGVVTMQMFVFVKSVLTRSLNIISFIVNFMNINFM